MGHSKALFTEMDGRDLRIGVVVARWNNELTMPLKDGVIEGILGCNVAKENIIELPVPGAYEVAFGAKHLIDTEQVDAVVCLGVLIKGETMHFEYISEALTQGIMQLSLSTGIPVIYGVLNCMNMEQATARCIGNNNHGPDWGRTAVEMALLKK